MTRRRVGTWLGAGLIAVGAFLPWVVENPRYHGNEIGPAVLGMGSGLETFGLVTLILVILVAVCVSLRGPWVPALSVIVGTVAIGFSLLFLGDYGVMGRSRMFLTGPGVFATFVGGLLLVTAHLERQSGGSLPPRLHSRDS